MQAEQLFDADEYLAHVDPISAAASMEIEQATADYRHLLEIESLVEARARNYDRVHAPHVRAARVALGVGEKEGDRDCGIVMVVGGTLTGAGASAVVSLLVSDPAPLPALLGFMLMMLAGVATCAYAFGSARR